jgi:outer membrane protein assembly factor BamD (BamD/ComL family)
MSAFRCCQSPLLVALVSSCLLPIAGGCASMSPKRLMPWSSASADDAASSAGVQQASFEGEDQDKKLEQLTLSDLKPQNLTKAVKKVAGYGPNRAIARQLYDEAEGLYRQAAAKPENERQDAFVAAGAKYLEAAERWPGSALEQDSLYMAGESYFFADYYPKANDCYEKLIKGFPNNRYLDTVDHRRYAIAKYWLDQNRKNPDSWYAINFWDQERPWRDTHGYALRVYDKMRVDDPTGRLADDATMAAAHEHFINRKFQKADEYYTDLRQAYPTSEHQFDAHFNGMKAKLMSYLGPNYGGTSLDEADKLIKQMRRQFPRESAAEREYLDRAAAEIRYKKAEKVWRMAEYFHFRSEYQAAGMYYKRVLDEFEDTPFAEKSQARLAEIAGKPPKPQQYAPWLLDLLPKRDRITRVLDAVEEYEKQHPRTEEQSDVVPASGVMP